MISKSAVIALSMAIVFPFLLSAQPAVNNRPVIAFGGIFLIGRISGFPVYSRAKHKVDSALLSSLVALNAKQTLQFDIRTETGAEETKRDIDNPFSLGILITRDDIATEKFDLGTDPLYKSTVNIGLVVFIYQTLEGMNKRNIIYTAPMVGYSTYVNTRTQPSAEDIDAMFLKSTAMLFDSCLAKRMAALNVKNLDGRVVKTDAECTSIDLGGKDGLQKGQYVSLMDNNAFAGKGQVLEVAETGSKIRILTPGLVPKKNMAVVCRNLRGFSDETYQVVKFSTSSKKAAELFGNQDIGASISQFFTDFLSSKKGKIVLPARTGSWIEGSIETSEAILVKDGETFHFALPQPKYPLELELTGLSQKLVKENKVNAVYGYKVWLLCKSPSTGLSKEVDIATTRTKVNGQQEFSDKDVFFDLLFDVSLKSVNESGL